MGEDFVNGKKKNLKNSSGDKDFDSKKEPAQPLSKRQELNNHIVCMRNSVRQARVQIINRLISQIQRYKNRKGNPKEQEKAKRKADRILEEIHVLKKIKKDLVSLYALQATQKLDAVLNNPESSTEERVLARLSHHNVVIKEVQKYRDANPNWDKQIPVLLEMTREKRRKKKEDSNNPEESSVHDNRQHRKILKTAETDEDESDNDQEDAEDDDVLESDSDIDRSEKQDNISEEESEAESEEEEDEDDEDIPQPLVKAKPSNQKSPTVKPKQVNKAADEPKQQISKPLVLNKSEGTVKVKFLTDLNELEEDNFEQTREKKPVDITQAPQAKKPKSAFFVGGVDKPEPEHREQKSFQKSAPFNQNHHNGQSKPVYKKGKLISKPPNRSQGNFHQNRNEQPGFRKGTADNRFGGNAEPLGSKRPRFSGDYQEDKLLQPSQQAEPLAAEKLHPSWEAKKKQQQISLTEFKGKKIVFDDDD